MYGIFAGELEVSRHQKAIDAMKDVATREPIVKYEAYDTQLVTIGLFATQTEARRAVKWGKTGRTRKVKVRHFIKKLEVA